MNRTIYLSTLRATGSILLAGLSWWSAAPLMAASLDLAGPPGSGAFGRAVAVLPNGNFVVTDPLFDRQSPSVAADVGAVYLYNSAGTLLSTLTGSTASDQVGSGGVRVLANGNFVILSPNWNGTASKTGAVTWAPMATGLSGTVSAANSLTGSQANDQAGNRGITLLTNGNYVVISSFLDSGGTANTGAVTWSSASTGRTGVISTANSLMGTTANDYVGNGGVTALTNGHYVVSSPFWGGTAGYGAATWANGATGLTGTVSSLNSLVGAAPGDSISSSGITALTNGNYVVASGNCDNGAIVDSGAATFCNGTTGTTGVVTAANSLVSDQNNPAASASHIGSGGVKALTNGNYVVLSPLGIYSPADPNFTRGAITWGNGTTGRSGAVSVLNSYTFSKQIAVTGSFGTMGVTALANGHYVAWANGGLDEGAVAWGDGTLGLTGISGPANCLFGPFTDTYDLETGAYLGRLIASSALGSGGVVALTTGKYVVASPAWNIYTRGLDVGAVTLCSGTGPAIGEATDLNSLVGDRVTTQQNRFGSNVVALTNGNYVISSPQWEGSSAPNPVDAGAVTWMAGSTATTGSFTPGDSVTGSTAGDQVGTVTALKNGNYVISAPLWDGGAVNAGAVRWCSGDGPSRGAMTSANALVGVSLQDGVGTSVTPLADGNYVIVSSSFKNGTLSGAGAITFGEGTGGTTGPVSAANSVLGTVAFGAGSMVFDYDAPRRQLIVGRPASNIVTLWTAPPPAPAIPVPVLSNPIHEGNGAVRFNFTGPPGITYTVITTKDLPKPYADWSVLGTVPEISPGQYQYTSPPSTVPRRFFAVRVP